ncbi:MAG: SEL1-like repeat protein [Rhodospirillales bacterium]
MSPATPKRSNGCTPPLNKVLKRNLGSIYDNGKGVSQNYAEAVKWYRAAAEQRGRRGS